MFIRKYYHECTFMSINKKDELRAKLKGKMVTFCKINNIALYEFLNLSGISHQKWQRILNGRDAYFSAIVSLVRESKGEFSYEEFADLLEEKLPTDGTLERIKKGIKQIGEKKLKDKSNEKEFGKDPMNGL